MSITSAISLRDWFGRNKVIFFGVLQLVITTIIEVFDQHGEDAISAWVIGYSVAVAVLSFLARNARGQWATIATSMLSSIVVLGSLHDSGVVLTWTVIMIRIVLPFGLALIGLFLPPVKNRNYENSATIMAAKSQSAVLADRKDQEMP